MLPVACLHVQEWTDDLALHLERCSLAMNVFVSFTADAASPNDFWAAEASQASQA